MPEKITIRTDDGVVIVGNLYKKKEGGTSLEDSAKGGGPWALLLHMMPATKESWEGLATLLENAGFTVLAIDERGHGESVGTPERPLDYKKFTDAEQQAKLLDVEAAVRWLVKTQGAKESRLAIVGASIGANLAIAFAAEHRPATTAVALSPGIAYHGVNTEVAIHELAAEQKLYLAASDDDEYSFNSARELAAMRPKWTTLKELSGAGHGTNMFAKAPGFLEELAAWIVKSVK